MNNFVYFNSFTYHTIKFLQINFKHTFSLFYYICIMFIIIYVCLCATSLRSHWILCDPLDGL